jgi:hypothetical protein
MRGSEVMRTKAELFNDYKRLESEIYAIVAWEGRLAIRVHSRLNKMFDIVEKLTR